MILLQISRKDDCWLDKVSISIVTYNNADKISNLLNSIIKNTKGVTYKIYVIDNCSSDNTIEIIKENFPTVNIFQLPENVGFGEGHNQVLNVIDSQYHAIVNPDIIINSDAISDLVNYLDTVPDVVMITPRIFNSDGTEQYLPKKRPTLRYLISGRLKFIKYFLKLRNEYTMQDYNIQEPIDVDFSTGCFSIIRTDVFQRIKGFDNRFFMYFEDVDLTLRAKKYGRVIFYPKISVVHGWERSSAKNVKYLLIHIKSMIEFFCKWRNK